MIDDTPKTKFNSKVEFQRNLQIRFRSEGSMVNYINALEEILKIHSPQSSNINVFNNKQNGK